jgi:hypothetical protein
MHRLVLNGVHLGHGDIESVRIGDTAARVLSAQDHSVVVLTQPFELAEHGRVLPITLKSTSRGSAVYSGYRVNRPGDIGSVSPKAGARGGGTVVTITGQNLCGGMTDLTKVTLAGVAATILSVTKDTVVVRSNPSPTARHGAIVLHSVLHGITKANSKERRWQYNKAAQIKSVYPPSGATNGGELLEIHGISLCSKGCDDLRRVRVGNALISSFVSKTPERIVVRSPSASSAGGTGRRTVVVESEAHGRAVAPGAYTYNDEGVPQGVSPADVPINGGMEVLIPGRSLSGTPEQYDVLLAGVRAKVISVTPRHLTVLAGDAQRYCSTNKITCKHGLAGTVVVSLQGRLQDTGIRFTYNPPCYIKRAVPGGEALRSLVLYGANLGMGDEHITVNGQPAAIEWHHRRTGEMVTRVGLTTPEPMLHRAALSVVLSSPRVGTCVWHGSSLQQKGATAQQGAQKPAPPRAKSVGSLLLQQPGQAAPQWQAQGTLSATAVQAVRSRALAAQQQQQQAWRGSTTSMDDEVAALVAEAQAYQNAH